MGDSDKVKIKSVYNTGESNGELMVKIKNDYINDSFGVDFSVFTDRNDPSKSAVIATKGDSVYAGNCEPSLCQNYLIIVNKNKKRARLLPINVCDLAQVKVKNDDAKPVELSDFNKTKLLSDKFGSKKSKRRMELTNKMRVNAEACEVQLKPVLDETVIDESYLVDLYDCTESLQRLVPPCNRFASTVDCVYDLNDLLIENERESLKEAAENLKENPPVKEDNKFLYMHYEIVAKSSNVERFVLLLYVDSLRRLLKINKWEMWNQEVWNSISPHSKLIMSKLKREFIDHKIFTKQMQHKVICHILVALLLACDYNIHLAKITPFLSGVNSRILHQLCGLVGVKVTGDVLSLRLPLPPLPAAKTLRKKKRKL